MTRHKGQSKRTAITASDLKEIADCYRTIQRIAGGLNYASHQTYPLLATAATIKACWAELSGATVAAGWSYPDTMVPRDGLAPGADRSGVPPERTFIQWGQSKVEE